MADKEIPFNKEATRWHGVPTHPEAAPRHPAKEGKECHETASPAHWADGTLSSQLPEDRDCLRPVGRYVRSELWWKGDVRGSIGRAAELQTLANQEARVTRGIPDN